MSIKGQAYIAGAYEHPTRKAPDKSTAQLHAEVRARRARRCGAADRAMSTAISAPATRPAWRPMSMVDYLNLKVRHVDSTETGGSSYLIHVGACRAGDRRRQMRRRADHARRPAAQRRPATGTALRAAQSQSAGRGVREPVRRRRSPTCTRMVARAAHARVRHHARAARLDQGRRLAPCAAQSARHAARCGHGRGRAQLADDRRPAAPARLLRRQRRRRRAHRRTPRNRAALEAAAGEGASAPAKR